MELYFWDDTEIPIERCFRSAEHAKIRIPLQDIENPVAYLNAPRRYKKGPVPLDLKWSPLFERYFTVAGYDRGNGLRPELLWSSFRPDADEIPTFPTLSNYLVLPHGEHLGEAQAIICNGFGQTLDTIDGE